MSVWWSFICILPVNTFRKTRIDTDVLSFGVVKAFLEADLVPRVVTGTSAGGIVAALLCTRTDTELKRLLVPQLADKITACEESMRIWLRRFMKEGARFSAVEWARKVCRHKPSQSC